MDGEIVVTARRRRGQLILTQVSAAGLPVEAVVDTGSEITIGNLALRDKLIRGNRDKFVTVTIDRRDRRDRRAAAGADRRAKAGVGNVAQCADGLCRRAAVHRVRPRQAAGTAARHRPAGNVPPRVARFSGAKGPLPAAANADRAESSSAPRHRPRRAYRRETTATSADGSVTYLALRFPALVY